MRFSFQISTPSGTLRTDGEKFQIYFMFEFTRKSAVFWAALLGTVKSTI